jgi:NAD(P)-dependent dehydrogenase (short-subunit alcohol dehydrogenase family)
MVTSPLHPVCVVTGGSHGIGLATALRFGHLGYRVLICGRNPQALETAHAQIAAVAPGCASVALDVGKPDEVARLIDTARHSFGRVDVLVNNAGHAPMAPVDKISYDDLATALAVNVAAVFHTTQAVWPMMREQSSGVIINISSLASVDPFTGFSVYGACKAWVNLFTKAIADEGRPLGVRAYSVALGAVETRLLRSLFPDFPAKQTLSPEEVALFLSALCEEPMRHATGQTLILKK